MASREPTPWSVETKGFDPFWLVTRHADVATIIRQHELFHNGDRAHTLVPRASDEMTRALTGGSPHPIRTLVHMDEPDHLKYRRITQSWFTMQRVGSLEYGIRAIARASIDRMAEHDSVCDFVRDVAIHYPLRVLMQILGVPQEDEPWMLKLTQELFASEDVDLRHGERRAAIQPDMPGSCFVCSANFRPTLSRSWNDAGLVPHKTSQASSPMRRLTANPSIISRQSVIT